MKTPQEMIPVAVLGATGMVGEQLLALLAHHPWFRVVEVAASDRSAGQRLGARLGAAGRALPSSIVDLTLKSLDDAFEAPLVLSALPADRALEVEARLAGAGHLVVSNASAFRADAQVPLLVPDVNPQHLDLLDAQRTRWGGGSGGIITNPNCSVAGLVVALAPLHQAFGLRSVVVTTLQAISGAGRPGPAAGDLVDNIIPFIGNEEDKVEREPRKILGGLVDGAIVGADFTVSATCTRVPVLHGHTASVSVAFQHDAKPQEVVQVLRDFASPLAGLGLPTMPRPSIEVFDDENRPQPRLDRDLGNGMTVSVGRIRRCGVHHASFVVLSHNLIRGAAGAALLNAELAVARGRLAR
jgi:aspartate-semialdehyde dehydrogenase